MTSLPFHPFSTISLSPFFSFRKFSRKNKKQEKTFGFGAGFAFLLPSFLPFGPTLGSRAVQKIHRKNIYASLAGERLSVFTHTDRDRLVTRSSAREGESPGGRKVGSLPSFSRVFPSRRQRRQPAESRAFRFFRVEPSSVDSSAFVAFFRLSKKYDETLLGLCRQEEERTEQSQANHPTSRRGPTPSSFRLVVLKQLTQTPRPFSRPASRLAASPIDPRSDSFLSLSIGRKARGKRSPFPYPFFFAFFQLVEGRRVVGV